MATFALGETDVSDFGRNTMSYPQYDTETIITSMWLLALELGTVKKQIATDWASIKKLEAEMALRPDHPKIGIAHQRCDGLTYRFIYACVNLQQIERRLDSVWRLMGTDDREYPAEVLGVPPTRRSLLGGIADYYPDIKLPEGFLWPESALHWCPPQQEDALVKRVGIEKALRMSFLNIRKVVE